MKAPLFLPFFFLLTGIFWGQNFPFGLVYFWLVLLFAVLGYFFSKPLLIFCAFFALGSLWIQEKVPYNDLRNYLKTPVVQAVSGQIVSQVEYNQQNDFYSFVLRVDSVAGENFEGLVKMRAQQSDLRYGQVVFGVAQLQKPEGASNPSGFSYAQYLAQKNIYTLADAKSVLVVKAQKGNFVQRFVYKIRKFLLARIEQRCGKNARFMQTILLGKDLDDESLRTNFTKSWSGAHFGNQRAAHRVYLVCNDAVFADVLQQARRGLSAHGAFFDILRGSLRFFAVCDSRGADDCPEFVGVSFGADFGAGQHRGGFWLDYPAGKTAIRLGAQLSALVFVGADFGEFGAEILCVLGRNEAAGKPKTAKQSGDNFA